MNFDNYKHTINMIHSCTPCAGWDFEKMLTLLDDVVLKLDAIETHVDEGIDRITDKL